MKTIVTAFILMTSIASFATETGDILKSWEGYYHLLDGEKNSRKCDPILSIETYKDRLDVTIKQGPALIGLNLLSSIPMDENTYEEVSKNYGAANTAAMERSKMVNRYETILFDSTNIEINVSNKDEGYEDEEAERNGDRNDIVLENFNISLEVHEKSSGDIKIVTLKIDNKTGIFNFRNRVVDQTCIYRK